jgi:hypothetical protein
MKRTAWWSGILRQTTNIVRVFARPFFVRRLPSAILLLHTCYLLLLPLRFVVVVLDRLLRPLCVGIFVVHFLLI